MNDLSLATDSPDGILRPRTWSKRHPFPDDSVYVGRPTRWGHPFKLGRDGSQTDVVSKYARWIAEPARADLRRRARTELSGKHLNVLVGASRRP